MDNAEELISAAAAETHNSVIVASKETAEGIQCAVQELEGLRKDTTSTKESHDAMLNTINQNLLNLMDALLSEIKKQKKTNDLLLFEIKKQHKMQRIKWAQVHLKNHCCKILQPRIIDERRFTQGKDVLYASLDKFWRDQAHFIHSCRYDTGYSKQAMEEAANKFRTDLVEELHSLLGDKPRLQTYNDGRISICYN